MCVCVCVCVSVPQITQKYFLWNEKGWLGREEKKNYSNRRLVVHTLRHSRLKTGLQ